MPVLNSQVDNYHTSEYENWPLTAQIANIIGLYDIWTFWKQPFYKYTPNTETRQLS